VIGWGDEGITLDEKMVRRLIQPGVLEIAPAWTLRGALAFFSARDESADDPNFRKFADDARSAIRAELERRGEVHGRK